jgi:tubulin--tyrosine ligase
VDKDKRMHTFELLGYDFMIDDVFKPWLIEVNTNPCLDTSSIHLVRIISALIDNTLQIALDPLFPVKRDGPASTNINQYELIYTSNNQ